MVHNFLISKLRVNRTKMCLVIGRLRIQEGILINLFSYFYNVKENIKMVEYDVFSAKCQLVLSRIKKEAPP